MLINYRSLMGEQNLPITEFLQIVTYDGGSDRGVVEDIEKKLTNVTDSLGRLLDILAKHEILNAPQVYFIVTGFIDQQVVFV